MCVGSFRIRQRCMVRYIRNSTLMLLRNGYTIIILNSKMKHSLQIAMFCHSDISKKDKVQVRLGSGPVYAICFSQPVGMSLIGFGLVQFRVQFLFFRVNFGITRSPEYCFRCKTIYLNMKDGSFLNVKDKIHI